MNPPFTVEQFLGVFAAYNTAIWPAQIVAYALGLIVVAALPSGRTIASPLILSILALMWAWNGIAYHFVFFATINPAAPLFAALFFLQAILFAISAATGKGLRFGSCLNFKSITGFIVIAYAMLIYPILGALAGHGLIAGPMFGVAPCPTTIFTIGLLLLAQGRWVLWLAIIPLLWSLIGFAAAWQLAIPEDVGLGLAGVVLALVLGAERISVWLDRKPSKPAAGVAGP